MLANSSFEIFTMQEKWVLQPRCLKNCARHQWEHFILSDFVFSVISSVWTFWLSAKSSGRPRIFPSFVPVYLCKSSSRWQTHLQPHMPSMLTVWFGVSQLLWADPVPGWGEEESFFAAVDVTLPFLPCGKCALNSQPSELDQSCLCFFALCVCCCQSKVLLSHTCRSGRPQPARCTRCCWPTKML